MYDANTPRFPIEQFALFAQAVNLWATAYNDHLAENTRMAAGLSDVIKAKVTQGIREEMRPGGLLASRPDTPSGLTPEKAKAIREEILGIARTDETNRIHKVLLDSARAHPYVPLPITPGPTLAERVDQLTAQLRETEQQLRTLAAASAARPAPVGRSDAVAGCPATAEHLARPSC